MYCSHIVSLIFALNRMSLTMYGFEDKTGSIMQCKILDIPLV